MNSPRKQQRLKKCRWCKNTVTNVQNSQDGFEKRMTTVEQTTTGLSSTVSNLNNVISDQGKSLLMQIQNSNNRQQQLGRKSS